MKLFKAILAFTFICLAQGAIAQGAKTSTNFYNAQITFKEIFNKIQVVDPVTGIVSTKEEKRGEIPLTLNGSPIYDQDNASQPVGSASQSDLYNYLQTNLLLEELDNNRGQIDNIDIIIDEKGRVNFVRIFFRTEDKNKVFAAQEAINKKLSTKTFIPAQKDGKAVAYRINIQGL